MSDQNPEELHDLTGLLHDADIQRQLQLADSYLAGHKLASEHSNSPANSFDLELIPPYMRNEDGGLVDANVSEDVARRTLELLHDKWRGFAKTENPINDHVKEVYWEFVDNDFFPWTVVETHDSQTLPSSISLTARVCSQRPKAYQDMINANQDGEETRLHPDALIAQPKWQDSEPKRAGRLKRFGRAISKALDVPPGGNVRRTQNHRRLQ